MYVNKQILQLYSTCYYLKCIYHLQEGVSAIDQAGGWGDEAEKVMELLSSAGGTRTMEILTVEDVAKVSKSTYIQIYVHNCIYMINNQLYIIIYDVTLYSIKEKRIVGLLLTTM